MLFFPWWAWVILAGALGLAELHLPGSYLMWIALGAGVTAVATVGLGLSFSSQIGMFAAGSAACCLAGYFVYRSAARQRPSAAVLNERSRLMLGARGVVCEAFVNGQGKVRLADGVWLAAGPDMEEGAAVVVSSVQGTRVNVEPLRPRAPVPEESRL